jgi:hypothetical protein
MSKKIVIPKEQLPNLIAGETDCFIRFRLRTADFGRFSAWSPIYAVTPTVAYRNTLAGLEEDMATIQAEVGTLQTDVNTAEGNITTLQGDVITIEGDVTNLYGISDDNFAMSVVL